MSYMQFYYDEGGLSVVKTEEVLQMSRKKVGMAVALLTSHYLNKLHHTIGIVENLNYKVLCEKEVEESQHMLGECLDLTSTSLR